MISTGLAGAVLSEFHTSNLSSGYWGRKFLGEKKPVGCQRPINFRDGLYEEIHDHEAFGYKVAQRQLQSRQKVMKGLRALDECETGWRTRWRIQQGQAQCSGKFDFYRLTPESICEDVERGDTFYNSF